MADEIHGISKFIGGVEKQLVHLNKATEEISRKQDKTNAEMIAIQLGQADHAKRLEKLIKLEEHIDNVDQRVKELERNKKTVVWLSGKIWAFIIGGGAIMMAAVEFVLRKIGL